MTRLAFLADIHGNLPALEAVIGDLRTQSPDAVFLVGDQINRCPWSNDVMDLVTDLGWPAIYGNHELVLRRLSEPHGPIGFDDQRRFPDLWWTVRRLGPHRLQAIAQLPPDLSLDLGVGPTIRLVHGVPGNPFRGVFLHGDAQEVDSEFAGIEESITVCGHTHHPLHRTLGRRQIFNGGSVGIPYNGDPRAQYLLLTSTSGGWTPIYRRVEYPVRRVREEFVRRDLFKAYGPLAGIFLRTIETAQPWASDFGHWLNAQHPKLHRDLETAVTLYERKHGPGQWSFMQR